MPELALTLGGFDSRCRPSNKEKKPMNDIRIVLAKMVRQYVSSIDPAAIEENSFGEMKHFFDCEEELYSQFDGFHSLYGDLLFNYREAVTELHSGSETPAAQQEGLH